MALKNTTSINIVLKQSTDVENESKVVSFGNNATISVILRQIADKLSILGGLEEIVLFGDDGTILTDIPQIKSQKIVYVDTKQPITDVIPGPTGLPFIGALYDLLPDIMVGWLNLFKKHGPVVRLNLMGREFIGTFSPEVSEIFVKESEYFTKKILLIGGLSEVKTFAGIGLFTSDTDSMDWKLAHKLLMPAFSPRAIKVYQGEMSEITQQAIQVIDQFKPDDQVDILEWCTNITFQTIGKIGFGYDFNILSSSDQPQNDFIDAMGYCLNMALTRMLQARFMRYLPLESNRKFERSVKSMHKIVEDVIAARKNSPDAHDSAKDLLGYMLNARDEHQLGLSDENIRDQVLTFLIAGHDTTANTMAWLLYQLSKNPDVEAKILQEIADNHITWDKHPTVEQINNLKYMNQAIKETLRMYSPLRALTKYCKKDCIIPGGYKIKEGMTVTIQLFSLHYNPETYPDPYKFDPDRWTPEEEQKRSRYAWLPFSTGPRGCIGMAFALQEAKTVLSMFLHKYQFKHEGPDVKIHPKMITTKPKDLYMTIHPRTNFPKPRAEANAQTKAKTQDTVLTIPKNFVSPEVILPPITFLYGTQTGTARDYADQLRKQAKNFGFKNITFCEMNQWKVLQNEKLITGDKTKNQDKEIVVICTATYNGQPPDSADKFNQFLDFKVCEDGHKSILKGLSFAVFGLGNKNWRTYQSFPIKVADSLEELGASRLFMNGEGDADKDIEAEFNTWSTHFWIYILESYGITASESKPIVPVVASTLDQTQSVSIKITHPKNYKGHGDNNHTGTHSSTLIVNRELQKQGSPRSTRHIEIDTSKLSPIDKNYRYSVGDHLEIAPENSQEDVEAIAKGFGLDIDSVFEIDQSTADGVSSRSLAAHIKTPCSVRDMLTYYADIASPPSRNLLGYFANQLNKVSPEVSSEFKALLTPNNQDEDQYPAFIAKHRNLLDLQRAYPQVNQLDLGQFLVSVSVIQPRRYSIASSPLVHPNHVHLAISVVDDIINGKHYPGLTTSYLKRSQNGTLIRASLKSSRATFSLPENPNVPLVLIAAGTGIAPFRGFLQERKAQLDAGQSIGQTTLFFGCRRHDQDYIYEEELNHYIKAGVLSKNYVAFSRSDENACYVQHQLVAHAHDVWRTIFPSNPDLTPGLVYVCGSGAMSRDVRRALSETAVSFGAASDIEGAEQVVNKLSDEGRLLWDVWG